jgi:hypothetical protein
METENANPIDLRFSDEEMLPMRRSIVVPSALAFTVLTALAACAPGPAAPVNAQQQQQQQQQQTPASCGGDQGMAAQFYRNLNGAPSMGPPPSKCP